MNTTELNEKIKNKEAEIVNYNRILSEYGSGRWLDMGRRHMAELKNDLKFLQKQLDEASTSAL